jgi:hypothetical protein
MLKQDAKMTFEEMEQVAGGLEYYSEKKYRDAGIYMVNGGKAFYYGNHELDEEQAAAMVFYMNRKPNAEKERDTLPWKTFLHKATAHVSANPEAFKLSYKPNANTK